MMGEDFDLWESLITSVFILPIAIALDTTGWNKWIVDSINTVSEWTIKNLYKYFSGGDKWPTKTKR
jgi:hypothetical protein